MNSLSIVFRVIIGFLCASILLTDLSARAATLDSHTVVLDESGNIIPWTTDPTQGYDQVMNLAWNYLTTGVPIDSQNGKPLYYSYSCMEPGTRQAMDWPHNPAGLYGMLTESALKYYGYSGNILPVVLAENVASALLANGMTPNDASWNWRNVPYASGDAGSLIYHGASFGDVTGQGDGTGVIEPDKLGEMGYAWLQLYRFNGNTNFRDAAIAAADALASHVRSGTAIDANRSPWPFRVYAQTGVVREEYGADVIGPITLLDGLIRLGLGNVAAYQTARQIAWDWMMTYPMQNNIWANYFEDIAIQPGTANVTQYNAMMTARYLLEHPEMDPSWESHVRGLISWVESIFAVPSYGANTISIAEQIQFKYPMGSHTSRYASINALLHEKTGDADAREKAYRSLNWATYMARENGIVIDGPEVNHVWFTDGYGDYIRHFMTSLGAVPDWSPAGQNHLLRSSAIVKNVQYLPNAISYTTSDGASTEVFRIIFTPAGVTVDGQALNQRLDLNMAGWTFDPFLKVMRVRHDAGTNVMIVSGTLVSIAVTPADQTIYNGSTRQFTATGTYSDGSIQNITDQTTWTSSNTGVASISSTGLATAGGIGSTTIAATLSGITGSTGLTVEVAPLVVTTAALPEATLSVSYSASLTASGGTPPYSWSIVAGSGSLPGGLSLNSSTGALSGTPTAAGTFSFTVQASDAGAYQMVATKPLTITVAELADFTIWPSTLPVIADSGPDSAVELGVRFRSGSNGFITGIRFYKASTNSGTHIGNLWSSSGTRLATATFTDETSSGWQQVNFATPVAITANTVYIASYHTNTGHYSCDQYYFTTTGVDRPPLHAPADGVYGANGVYAYGSGSSFPGLGWRSSNYWVDVVLRSAVPPPVTLSSIAVTPVNPSLQVGTTLQFTATGTYSDGSTQNISGQATWVSSNTGAATIISTGLATTQGAGSTTISATLGGITGSTMLTVQIPPLTISTAALPGGTPAIPYTATLAASGGTPPYSWSIVAGSGELPGGVTLNSSAGIVSGTPTATGTFSFTVQASDSGIPQLIATRTLSITIIQLVTLSSIAVTPVNPSIQVGAALQFTATGTYSDGSTQNITGQTTWASSNIGVATISSTGLATSGSAGISTISATLDGITGSTTLSVQAAPLVITTVSLPGGTQNAMYSSMLAAIGGVQPYSWTLSAGSLPAGLLLNSLTGVVSGTPTVAGSSIFTVQVSDAGTPPQATIKTMSILITAVPPISPAPVLDIFVTTKQSVKSRTISSPSFSTSRTNELLVAFIASDGPGARGSQSITTVTGGGLSWTRRARANAQAGTAEIWQARAANVVTNVTVTATRANGSYQGMITVAAFHGASLATNGAAVNASAARGAPTVSLVSTRANSLIWGVGDDWDRAVVRTVSSNQTILTEFLAPAGDTFWVQYITEPVASAGVTATISCTEPTNDRWNLAAIEIVAQ